MQSQRVVILTFGAPGSGKTSACQAVSGADIKLVRRQVIYDVKSKDSNLMFIDVSAGLRSNIALQPIFKQVLQLNLVLLFTSLERFQWTQVEEIKAALRYLNIKREMIHLIVTKTEGFSDAKRDECMQFAFKHPNMTEITNLFKTGMRGSHVEYERCHFMFFTHPVFCRPEVKDMQTKLYFKSRDDLIELAANAACEVPMEAAPKQRNTWWRRIKDLIF